ncbi:MAG: glucose-6-phosphate isomerase, partial [Planctomycetes bacterium]|nr:glucose-6-phosphate isomerase [Planctomycetota bacterium]
MRMSTIATLRPNKTPAWRRLRQLAKDPFDLVAPKALSPARLRRMRASAAGFDLLYATDRVTPEILDALGQLA